MKIVDKVNCIQDRANRLGWCPIMLTFEAFWSIIPKVSKLVSIQNRLEATWHQISPQFGDSAPMKKL